MTSYPWALVLANYLDYAITLLVAVLALVAALDCLRRQAVEFERAWKRTKTFWLALTGGAAVVSVFSAVFSTMTLVSIGVPGTGSLILMLVAATIAGVYLADVRPAVGGPSRNPRRW
ncbi:hypothetical protein KVA01_21160 [Kocuria varians]|uniref:DUF2516 domain-containing protein n=1 Tax=Kocuria varians TaxID=1272 RepID=A0A4Y4D447_KOCVA|nr:DUF2516 family protein [Kocuria varians]GEC99961.1 hypothetical protein KVA01_21160 [Kocuria varians]